jgi:adenylate cyclase
VSEVLRSPYLIVAMTMAGTALILFASDRGARSTRALSLCLFAIALAAFLHVMRGGEAMSIPEALLDRTCKLVAILAGIEWGRRIGQTAQSRARVAAHWLFRVAQLLALVYGLLNMGYVIVMPESALHAPSGVVAVRPGEFAVFAPILGTSMLCAVIAGFMLRWMRIDRAELVRLRALLLAGPFLIAALVVGDAYIPAALTIGLLIFLAGSVRYLMIQSQRGSFMRQFLSPDVARLVQAGGIDSVLKRERRPMSVVVCDLRRFTAFARERDSDAVAEVLERFYEIVGKVAAKHGGTVKDHAGDGVLILVGAPIAFKDHARRAQTLALDLADEFARTPLSTAPGLGLGIGIATGTLTVGAIRGAGRLEYVAVGNAVNLAARLCMRAEDGEILADQRTASEGVGEGVVVQMRAPEPLKGFTEPIEICALSRLPA